MFSRIVISCVASVLAIGSTNAAAIGLTLSSDKDPLSENITFTVGITPSEVITGYTLDIRYDTTELDFLSSTQLVPFFGGAFVPPFTLDPATTPGDPGSTGLATSDSGRASVLQTSNSEPVGSLFDLTFRVLTRIDDGLDDLTIGILNAAANDINPPIGGSPFTIDPAVVTYQVVPVPAALPLFLSALAGLGFMARRKALV